METNTITLTGNLTHEPELRYTTGGRARAALGLAVNRRWQTNGEWHETTSFLTVVAWGDLAEHAAASLAKGSRVLVSGRLEQRTYENDTGDKRSALEIVADDLGPSLRWATAAIARVERATPTPNGTVASQPAAVSADGSDAPV